MPASVLQINVSKGGIPKLPIPEARVTPLGIEGDGHAHPQFHGGPRQAVLLISSEGIAELAAFGYPVLNGTLGENITTQGLNHRDWRIGQQWKIGSEVVIEFTKVRVPCKTLNKLGRGIQAAIYDEIVQANDPSSPHWGLSGIYAKVLTGGTIRPGDPILPA
jgi:MOSC domain-containing protein YiiM